jgi:hypothetical protein
MTTKGIEWNNNKTVLKVRKAGAYPPGPSINIVNHNETVLKVRKALTKNHNETVLKIRK